MSTQYGFTSRASTAEHVPVTRCTYVLKEAQTTSLPSNRFKIESYLRKGTNVEVLNSEFHFDPAHGTFAHQRQLALEGRDFETVQAKAAAKLEEDHPIPPSGPHVEDILAHSSAEAQRTGKRQILIFSASWCGPCQLLHRALLNPLIKPIIDAHFVVVNADVYEPRERRKLENVGGTAFMKRLLQRPGLPSMAFLDTQGKKVDDAVRILAETPAKEKRDLLIKLRLNAPTMTDSEYHRLQSAFGKIAL